MACYRDSIIFRTFIGTVHALEEYFTNSKYTTLWNNMSNWKNRKHIHQFYNSVRIPIVNKALRNMTTAQLSLSRERTRCMQTSTCYSLHVTDFRCCTNIWRVVQCRCVSFKTNFVAQIPTWNIIKVSFHENNFNSFSMISFNVWRVIPCGLEDSFDSVKNLWMKLSPPNYCSVGCQSKTRYKRIN